MLGLGVPEILFILVLALLLFGPKRLPEIGRTLGKGLNEFRKASNELKRTINTELALDEEEHPRPQPQRVAPYSAAPEAVPAPVPAIAAVAATTSPEAPAVLAAEAPVDGMTVPPIEPAAPSAAAPSHGSLERALPAGTLARGAGVESLPGVSGTAVVAPAISPGDHHAAASESSAPVAPVAVTAAPLDPR